MGFFEGRRPRHVSCPERSTHPSRNLRPGVALPRRGLRPVGRELRFACPLHDSTNYAIGSERLVEAAIRSSCHARKCAHTRGALAAKIQLHPTMTQRASLRLGGIHSRLRPTPANVLGRPARSARLPFGLSLALRVHPIALSRHVS